jgi:hypothetical protein
VSWQAAFSPSADPHNRTKVELISQIVATFGDEIDEVELQALKAAIEKAHGQVEIRMLHAINGENGA